MSTKMASPGTLLYIGVCLYIYSIRKTDAKSVEVCLTEPGYTVAYNCGSGERIHVVSILYQEASRSCLPTPGGCQLLMDNSCDGWTSRCSGFQTCNESILYFYFKTTCVIRKTAIATVTYACVKDQSIGMCQAMTSLRNVDLSPNLFGTYSVDVTDIYLDSSNQKSSTIIGILRGKVVVQGIVIIALILYFKCVQPRRQLKPPSTESNHVYYNINTNTASQELPPQPDAGNMTNVNERTSQEQPQQHAGQIRTNVYARVSPYQNTDNVYTELKSDRITLDEDTMPN